MPVLGGPAGAGGRAGAASRAGDGAFGGGPPSRASACRAVSSVSAFESSSERPWMARIAACSDARRSHFRASACSPRFHSVVAVESAQKTSSGSCSSGGGIAGSAAGVIPLGSEASRAKSTGSSPYRGPGR